MVKYTWKEIKAAALQEAFSWEGHSSLTASDNQDYLNAMPDAANKGLQRIYGRITLRHSKELECKQGINLIDLDKDVTDWRSSGRMEAWQQTGNGMCELTEDSLKIIAHRWLQINAPQAGTVVLRYNAWPPKITENTEDDFELDIKPDAAVLLSYYIVSEIYGDDDPSMASSYRNRYEMGLDELEMTESQEQITVDVGDCPTWDL